MERNPIRKRANIYDAVRIEYTNTEPDRKMLPGFAETVVTPENPIHLYLVKGGENADGESIRAYGVHNSPQMLAQQLERVYSGGSAMQQETMRLPPTEERDMAAVEFVVRVQGRSRDWMLPLAAVQGSPRIPEEIETRPLALTNIANRLAVCESDAIYQTIISAHNYTSAINDRKQDLKRGTDTWKQVLGQLQHADSDRDVDTMGNDERLTKLQAVSANLWSVNSRLVLYGANAESDAEKLTNAFGSLTSSGNEIGARVTTGRKAREIEEAIIEGDIKQSVTTSRRGPWIRPWTSPTIVAASWAAPHFAIVDPTDLTDRAQNALGVIAEERAPPSPPTDRTLDPFRDD